MCSGMIDLKKAMTRITELEEELKATREDYEEEIVVLVDKNDDLIKKIGIFMGDPTPVEEDEEPEEIRPEDYIIIDDGGGRRWMNNSRWRLEEVNGG